MEQLNREQLIHLNPLAEIDRLREVNAQLLAALEGQGGAGHGTWHLWTCPNKPCLKECREARAAIDAAKS